MRARVILFDDGFMPVEKPDPIVVQSLDVPIIGRPDPGPAPAEGDIRVPGSTVRLRLAFLDDLSTEPWDGARELERFWTSWKLDNMPLTSEEFNGAMRFRTALARR